MRRWVIMFMLVAVAGCVSPAGTDTVDGEDGASGGVAGEAGASDGVLAAEPDQTWHTERLEFTLFFDAAKAMGAALLNDGAPHIEFEPRAGVRNIVVELDWESDVFDLDLATIFPEHTPCALPCTQEAYDHWIGDGDDGNFWVQDGRLGAPDHPVRLVIDGAALDAYGCRESCPALAVAWTKTVAVDVTGVLAVTLFEGDVPEDFTAL